MCVSRRKSPVVEQDKVGIKISLWKSVGLVDNFTGEKPESCPRPG